MRKILYLLLLALLPINIASASVELFQIVVFDWEDETKTLKLVSLGSGTAIDNNLILTNKHVIEYEGRSAEFLLLCQASEKSTRGVTCDVPAGVVAVHDKFDAALVKPLDRGQFFPEVRKRLQESTINSSVRVAGFPIPLDGVAQNFGGNKTLDAFKAWEARGDGVLEFEGDPLTITRGVVTNKGTLTSTGGRYLVTDVKVNFGNSGGAAFDQYGDFIGIPTLKDTNDNAYILSYDQLKNWVAENQTKYPIYETDAADFYTGLVEVKSEAVIHQSLNYSKRSYVRSRNRGLSIKERLRLRRGQKPVAVERNTSIVSSKAVVKSGYTGLSVRERLRLRRMTKSQ